MLNSEIENKLKRHLDKLFSGIHASKQLHDLQEELMANLSEKVADYRKEGMDDEQAIKEAIISMGDISGLIDELNSSNQASHSNLPFSPKTLLLSNIILISGIMLLLFGCLATLMFYFMAIPVVGKTGGGIFIVLGGGLITFSFLARDTKKRYGMSTIRAVGYGLSVSLILFSIFVAFTSGLATGEMYIAIASLMVFFLLGVCLLLILLFSEKSRFRN